MKLSKPERLNLYLRFRTLDAISPKEGWDHFAEIVKYGYESYYSSIEDMIYDEVPLEDCRFVEAVFSMFDALQWPFRRDGKDIPLELRMFGFDGNNETSLMSYAQFLRSNNRWEHVVSGGDDMNSHFPARTVYERMLEVYHAAGSPHELTGDTAKSVIAAAVHPDNR